MSLTRSGSRHLLVRHPSAVLLVVQLSGVLLYPYTENTAWGRYVFEVFGALVLGLAVWSVRNTPTPTWIALILGVEHPPCRWRTRSAPALAWPWPRPRCTRCSTSGRPAT